MFRVLRNNNIATLKPDYQILEDSTIVDSTGKIIFFSVEKFINEIALGDSCFICGAPNGSKEFNDEHVIPEWILRKYDMFDKHITLLNGEQFTYSKYKIPCCVDCNSRLGKEVEEPIGAIVSQGYDAVVNYIKENGFWDFFIWLNLIFLKVQLRDKFFRFFLDNREPDVKISELMDWNPLHHIHCIARSVYTKCSISSRVLGSFIVLPALENEHIDKFDYGDNIPGKGILIKIGDTCFISILNDSGASLNLFTDEMNRIEGILTPLQYREILAHLSFFNVNLVQRPLYFTSYNPEKGCEIIAELPEIFEYKNTNEFKFGDFLYMGCSDFFERSEDPRRDEIKEKVKEGRWTFLFDGNGDFIQC